MNIQNYNLVWVHWDQLNCDDQGTRVLANCCPAFIKRVSKLIYLLETSSLQNGEPRKRQYMFDFAQRKPVLGPSETPRKNHLCRQVPIVFSPSLFVPIVSPMCLGPSTSIYGSSHVFLWKNRVFFVSRCVASTANGCHPLLSFPPHQIFSEHGIMDQVVDVYNNNIYRYGKSPSLIGKSTINVPCSIAMLVYQRVTTSWDTWKQDETRRVRNPASKSIAKKASRSH